MSLLQQFNSSEMNASSVQANDETLNQEQRARVAVRTKLHVSNFPENCTRRMLTEFFSKFGVVLECAIMWDKYAFIHYGTMAEAQNALKQASHMYFMGNKLSIKLSTSRNRQSCDWYQHEAAKLALKLQQGELDLESDSGNFVETKLYVTNLPENCNQAELSGLFEQYGKVLECVIMWNHYAFVHFPNLREAKIALKHLNGYNYNGKTLVVQLSTSSNRPLPKCLAFENRRNSQSDSSSQRSGSSRHNSRSPSSSESSQDYQKPVTPDSNEAPKKDWIQLLKTGSLNLISPDQSVSTTFANTGRSSSCDGQTENILSSLLKPCSPVPVISTPFITDSELLAYKNSNYQTEKQALLNKFANAAIFEDDEEQKEKTVEEFVNDNYEYDNCNSSADIDSDLCTLNEAWSNRNPNANREEALGSPVSVCSTKSSVSSASECSWINNMGCLTLDQIPTPPLPNDEITVTLDDLNLKSVWPAQPESHFKMNEAFSRVDLDAELLLPLKSLSINYNSSESLSSGSRRPSSISTTSHSPSSMSDNFSADSVISSGNFEETIMNQCTSTYLTALDRNSTHSDNSLFMNFIEASNNQFASAFEAFSQRFAESQALPTVEERQQSHRAQSDRGQKVKLTRCKALNYILFPELKNCN